MSQIPLSSTQQQSDPMVFDLRREIEITAIAAYVIDARNPAQVALPMPTDAEILCSVTLNDRTILTNQLGVATASQWVNLRALQSCVRIWGKRVGGTHPGSRGLFSRF